MKRAIFIDGRRDAYSPAQCGNTMTVGELKEFLEQFNNDDEIFLRNDKGYTYGIIDCDSFESGEYDSKTVKLDYMSWLHTNKYLTAWIFPGYFFV